MGYAERRRRRTARPRRRGPFRPDAAEGEARKRRGEARGQNGGGFHEASVPDRRWGISPRGQGRGSALSGGRRGRRYFVSQRRGGAQENKEKRRTGSVPKAADDRERLREAFHGE